MTFEQVHLIRQSFLEIETRSYVAALEFYRQLFGMAPQLRHLFKNDIESQSRKLMDMLSLTISLLERPPAFNTELETLGARHLSYGTRTEHYDIVGRALLGMLAAVLGKKFTREVEQAWTELYDLIQAAMIRGAEHPEKAANVR